MGLSRFAIACAAVALFAFSAPASATTIVPGGTYALVAPGEYDFGPVSPFGPVNDVFTFTYSGGPVAATSVFTEIPPALSGYSIDWVKVGTGSLIGGPNLILLPSTTTALPLLGAGTYQFIISSSFALQSVITETITTTVTPLPASLVLFGSALFGGATILRRRKKSTAPVAA